MFNDKDLFSPSEYTAALLLYIRKHLPCVHSSRVLEMGTGSGVVIGTLLAMGAKSAVGIELETQAVQAAQELLNQEGLVDRAHLMQGDMWAACEDIRFDLVVTNLPQFATDQIFYNSRLPTWSEGGTDGRRCVDQFLNGLNHHLAPGGMALMTHNLFLDLGKTQAILDRVGLQARAVYCASVPLPLTKLACLNPQVLARFLGQGIHKMGNYWFVDFDIVEISWKHVRT